MDRELTEYWHGLIDRSRQVEGAHLTFPKFHAKASHCAPFLAILQDPDRSGAVKSGVCCCVTNKDPTAQRQKEIILDKVRLRGEQIVCWNFHASYEPTSRVDWAGERQRLVDIMPQLKAVLAFGGLAWRGMPDVSLPKKVILILRKIHQRQAASGEGEIARANCQIKVTYGATSPLTH